MPLPNIDFYQLDNGTKVSECNVGIQDVVKVDIFYNAGRRFEDKWFAARSTAKLLRSHTSTMRSTELEETLDFYGTSIKVAANLDISYISVVVLNKFFEPVMDLVHDMIYNPLFEEKELDKFKKNSQERHLQDIAKNDVVAYREHTALIFGEDHPYGHNTVIKDIESIQIDDVIHHYNKNFNASNCEIVISGRITSKIRNVINLKLGQKKLGDRRMELDKETLTQKGRYTFASQNKHQAAVRIGRKLFTRSHEDNSEFYVLNMILGGYFGSRLMSNIREKKGYTYNIYSGTDQLAKNGYFYVSTELDPKNVDNVIKDIYRQMDILKYEPIPDNELKMVVNYVMGRMLNLLDGPFNIGSFIRMIRTNDLSLKYYDDTIDRIKNISKEDIMKTAQKYFDKGDMTEVIVG